MSSQNIWVETVVFDLVERASEREGARRRLGVTWRCRILAFPVVVEAHQACVPRSFVFLIQSSVTCLLLAGRDDCCWWSWTHWCYLGVHLYSPTCPNTLSLLTVPLHNLKRDLCIPVVSVSSSSATRACVCVLCVRVTRIEKKAKSQHQFECYM